LGGGQLSLQCLYLLGLLFIHDFELVLLLDVVCQHAMASLTMRFHVIGIILRCIQMFSELVDYHSCGDNELFGN
jgi:hypothetical protein